MRLSRYGQRKHNKRRVTA
ncbi:hypothetical protein Goshw_020571 [Gossypium schwendimanii]|uniref:Uncharacterized protein n=1 Tax=Gossypium schwendimanii TaxID=34291 RepID=A0A7J9NA28_GOSSC|nr:hypothetical protein [Gossypium schwendimanii]